VLDKFLIRHPEFSKVDNNRISLALNDAAKEMSVRIWGDLYEKGLCALAAHLLYISGALTKLGTNNGKPIQVATSKSAGALSIGYTSPESGFSSNHKGLALNEYGREYSRLKALTARHFLVVR